MPSSALLALAMTLLAGANAALMAWLWRFPMAPDPASGNPHGSSTAPRSWTLVHRGLGYLFVVVYGLLLLEMLPRLWRFAEWSAISILHAALGLLIGLVLVLKIGVIRWWPRWSGTLPWLGGSLAALTLLVSLLGVVPLLLVVRPTAVVSLEAAHGRDLLASRCLQCHGASVIAGERERPGKWRREIGKMQERSLRARWATPIADAERESITAFLIETRSERDDEDGHDDVDGADGDRHGRRRRRGRD